MRVEHEPEGRQSLPPGWRWAKLGGLCEIIAGQSPPSYAYRKNREGIPFYQGKADFGHRHPVPRTWCVEPTKVAIASDILISIRAPVGPTNIADQECCIGRGLAAVRCGCNLDMEFLLFWLKKEEKNLEKKGSGSTFGAISRKELIDFEVPLPPLSEQKRIAAILNEKMEAIDKARAAAEAQLEAAKALAISYYRECFGRSTPLSAYKNTGTDEKGWRWHELNSVARLESGHTPSRNHPEWWGGDVPWLALPDIRRLDGKYAYETAEYTNLDGIHNSSARVLPEGTVCLSRTASVGYVTILGRPMATSQDFVNWICGPELSPDFLMHLFIYSRKYFVSLASGAIHKTVYVPTVKKLHVLIPNIDEQKTLVARLNNRISLSEHLRAQIEKQLNEINALPQALLRRAFNGEL